VAGAADERLVARIAAAQHGVVTGRQLRESGFGPRAILRRVEGGWLVRLHVGVYQVGVFGGPFAAEMAALLACGMRSAISHESSMAVYGVCSRPVGIVDVCVPRGSTSRRDGVRSHRATLPPCDVVVRQRVRVTTPARTLLDLAASTSPDELEGRLLMAGYRVLRVTWRQITREPELVVAMIATALAA